VNGSPGVNWFPEPSLSVFLRRWLAGHPYSEAVIASNDTATRWWRRLLKTKNDAPDEEHPWIQSSRQVVFGVRDVRIGDWRLETGDWRLETGDWRLETRDRRSEIGDRRSEKSLVSSL
jgi:hypothetical protein